MRPLTRDAPLHRPLKVVASGTLFQVYNLGLPTHSAPGGVARAHSVAHTRGGAASTALSIIAQFPGVEPLLVAPLGGNEEARNVLQHLQKENVNTKYCKIWENAGVPSAWVIQADDSDERTIINHNPLPDITHTEFVSLLGPLLAPENYPPLSPQTPPVAPPVSPLHPASFNLSPPEPNRLRRPTSTNPSNPASPTIPPGVAPRMTPAPFDWLHFEGRSVRTTLANLLGVASLARERGWRHRCVFSVDVGRNRQGVEALIPHADVLFLNASYAAAHSPSHASNPRSFLLSMLSLAPPHALLIAYWGSGPGSVPGDPSSSGGAALLSMPTREYLQASSWAPPAGFVPGAPASGGGARRGNHGSMDAEPSFDEYRSIRTGSSFWAGAHTSSSSAFTGFAPSSPRAGAPSPGSDAPRTPARLARAVTAPLLGTRGEEEERTEPLDEIGAQDAFIAGMMWALSRRVLPSSKYAPRGAADEDGTAAEREADAEKEGGRWKLDECLRFATELAGRKARRVGWEGLGAEMAAAGWFEP